MLDLLKEWGTGIVAVLALVQPWILATWRRYFRPGRIEIYETGTIEIGYSAFGPTIGLHGTLRACDRDLFIRSVHLELFKEKDQSRHRFEWGVFRSSKVIAGRPEELTLELPAGFMLLISQPHRFNIQFHELSRQDEIRKVLEPVQQGWFTALSKALPIQTHQACYQTFSQGKAHVTAFTELDRLCYWEAGKYQLTMTVSTEPRNRKFLRTWSFVFSQEDINSIRLNPIVILREMCGQDNVRYNFVYARYQES